MTNLSSLRREWLSNPRADILAGILVALALIPEAIGFSIIAGVDPKVGLYASFSIAVITALVAVMIMVSIGTFSWRSLADLKRLPWQSSAVMIVTVVTVVWTQDLAQGVVLSGLFFAAKVRRLVRVDSVLSEDGRTRTYRVSGQVFFASSERFLDAFDAREGLEQVVIDVSGAHFWDITAVGSLDHAVHRFRREGTAVKIVGLNEASATMVDRFGTHNKTGAAEATAH